MKYGALWFFTGMGFGIGVMFLAMPKPKRNIVLEKIRYGSAEVVLVMDGSTGKLISRYHVNSFPEAEETGIADDVRELMEKYKNVGD